MNSIIVSVKPEDCELISNDKKFTLLYRTKPAKINTPFKCYIFCSGGPGKIIDENDAFTFQRWNGIRLIKRQVDKGGLKDKPEQTWQILLDYEFIHPILKGDYELNGKVIGEFICDKIDAYPYDEHIGYPTPAYDGDDSFCDCGPGHWINGEELNEIGMTYEEFEEMADTSNYYGWHISDLKIYDKPKELYKFKSICNKKKCNLKCACYDDQYDGCHRYDSITNPPKPWCYVKENI